MNDNKIKTISIEKASEHAEFEKFFTHIKKCRGVVAIWVDSDNEMHIFDSCVNSAEKVFMAHRIIKETLDEYHFEE